MTTPLPLPPSVVSSQDLARLEIELSAFSDWFRHNAIKQEMHISKGTVMPGLSIESISMLKSISTGTTLTQTNIDTLLEYIQKLRQKAITISITLAAPAGKQLRQQLAEWCRRELDPTILVDFSFNATILGGMVVRYGSHVYDWSFRRSILNNRASFAEVLRRV